tara:strand:+ start:42 stop:650 length:609 start_codon:yes stop_codon:yes gene_type:complete
MVKQFMKKKGDFRSFIELQLTKGNTDWESRSDLIRSSGQKISGHNNRILKEYEKKFNFGSITEIKNKAIKNYFDTIPKNSLISVEGAVKIINQKLPKEINISETIIYSRLADPKFNINNLKGQTLDNQVSKFGSYDVIITEEFKEKIEKLKRTGVYLRIEETQRGSKILRLKTSEIYGNLDRSFPPNDSSIRMIKKLLNEKN